MSILIVYYSRTGHTAKVAKALAKEYQADVEQIIDVRSRTGAWGYLRSAREALRGRAAGIQPVRHPPQQYDLVIIGAPVWASNLPSPVRAYFELQDGNFPQVAFFCTQGGRGAEKVFKQMAQLCSQQPLATQSFDESDVASPGFNGKLTQFKKEIAELNQYQVPRQLRPA